MNEKGSIAADASLLDFRPRLEGLALNLWDNQGAVVSIGRMTALVRETPLGFLGFLRRPPAIQDAEALADFIDRNSAFLAQKGIYEYSRARAGHYAKVLFGEAGFQAAVETARWRAYPLGLAMVGELVEGVLRPHAGDDRRPEVEALGNLVLSVFDRYPVPVALGEETWGSLRDDLARRLQLVGLHPPKRVIDICEPYAQLYFDLMPIHEKLRGRDFPTTRSYLKVTLCNIHDELTKRLNAQAVAKLLSQQRASQ
jgi:hypothetical protein